MTQSEFGIKIDHGPKGSQNLVSSDVTFDRQAEQLLIRRFVSGRLTYALQEVKKSSGTLTDEARLSSVLDLALQEGVMFGERPDSTQEVITIDIPGLRDNWRSITIRPVWGDNTVMLHSTNQNIQKILQDTFNSFPGSRVTAGGVKIIAADTQDMPPLKLKVPLEREYNTILMDVITRAKESFLEYTGILGASDFDENTSFMLDLTFKRTSANRESLDTIRANAVPMEAYDMRDLAKRCRTIGEIAKLVHRYLTQSPGLESEIYELSCIQKVFTQDVIFPGRPANEEPGEDMIFPKAAYQGRWRYNKKNQQTAQFTINVAQEGLENEINKRAQAVRGAQVTLVNAFTGARIVEGLQDMGRGEFSAQFSNLDEAAIYVVEFSYAQGIQSQVDALQARADSQRPQDRHSTESLRHRLAQRLAKHSWAVDRMYKMGRSDELVDREEANRIAEEINCLDVTVRQFTEIALHNPEYALVDEEQLKQLYAYQMQYEWNCNAYMIQKYWDRRIGDIARVAVQSGYTLPHFKTIQPGRAVCDRVLAIIDSHGYLDNLKHDNRNIGYFTNLRGNYSDCHLSDEAMSELYKEIETYYHIVIPDEARMYVRSVKDLTSIVMSRVNGIVSDTAGAHDRASSGLPEIQMDKTEYFLSRINHGIDMYKEDARIHYDFSNSLQRQQMLEGIKERFGSIGNEIHNYVAGHITYQRAFDALYEALSIEELRLILPLFGIGHVSPSNKEEYLQALLVWAQIIQEWDGVISSEPELVKDIAAICGMSKDGFHRKIWQSKASYKGVFGEIYFRHENAGIITINFVPYAAAKNVDVPKTITITVNKVSSSVFLSEEAVARKMRQIIFKDNTFDFLRQLNLNDSVIRYIRDSRTAEKYIEVVLEVIRNKYFELIKKIPSGRVAGSKLSNLLCDHAAMKTLVEEEKNKNITDTNYVIRYLLERLGGSVDQYRNSIVSLDSMARDSRSQAYTAIFENLGGFDDEYISSENRLRTFMPIVGYEDDLTRRFKQEIQWSIIEFISGAATYQDTFNALNKIVSTKDILLLGGFINATIKGGDDCLHAFLVWLKILAQWRDIRRVGPDFIDGVHAARVDSKGMATIIYKHFTGKIHIQKNEFNQLTIEFIPGVAHAETESPKTITINLSASPANQYVNENENSKLDAIEAVKGGIDFDNINVSAAAGSSPIALAEIGPAFFDTLSFKIIRMKRIGSLVEFAALP